MLLHPRIFKVLCSNFSAMLAETSPVSLNIFVVFMNLIRSLSLSLVSVFLSEWSVRPRSLCKCK